MSRSSFYRQLRSFAQNWKEQAEISEKSASTHPYVRRSYVTPTSRRPARRRWPLGARRSRARTSAASRRSVCRSQQRTRVVSLLCRVAPRRSLSPSLSRFSLDFDERSHELGRSLDSFGSVYQCSRERDRPRGNAFLREVRCAPWCTGATVPYPVSRITSLSSRTRARPRGHNTRIFGAVSSHSPSVLSVTTRPRRLCVCVFV